MYMCVRVVSGHVCVLGCEWSCTVVSGHVHVC